ncbi:Src-domain containing protein [Metarhizium album ARSEF 1941]|uniref:Src-domain containing protein n=1 Tax=Metarhizium album (strain ARSEF 1941) TaxID=1081103 RepID=A0A0B2WV72_METAS|nr:Src-domain containing protein [Metarhizium album ARSEF 1941]KHN97973.1 Src-domain containing protein [Metarhizium album ARSEF 1941]
MALQHDADDVVEFLLAPFSDMVTKAKKAAANAGDEAPSMRKAAEALSKEGQRALNRLEPLCKKMSSQHGAAMAAVVRTNDDISSHHLGLTGLLWGFDDYDTVETFDQEKYAEVQALCRRVAPKIYNVLVLENIDLAANVSASESASASTLHSVPESPPTSPLCAVSQSSYTWQLDGRSDTNTNTEPSLAGSASWSDTSANHLHAGCQALANTTATAHRGLAPGPDYTVSTPGRRSGSSHSSGLFEVRPSPGRRPDLPIREARQAGLHLRQPWPLPRRLASRELHEAYVSSGLTASPETTSFHDAPWSWMGALEKRQPPSTAVPPTPAAQPPPRSCVIDESSSLRLYRGFCSGAKEVLGGNSGVRHRHKPVHRTLSRIVARCTGCSWELDSEHIENDQANRGKQQTAIQIGTMSRRDVHFRLRFLQKSHVAVKRADDRLYGCIFCAHNGHTLDESDATVFFSVDDLLAHVSRHPRPLPVIPGVVVVYGTHVPSHQLNNYDLQFKVPASRGPPGRGLAEVDGRPRGVAMKEVRRGAARRSVVDRDRPQELQVASGARLSGIRWPTQYKGRRVFAWHDGAFASLPSDVVMLVAPSSSLNGTARTAVSAKAKWKFSPKHGKAGWLRFDRGDTIANINWEHPDDWYWCGTTRRGEWGVFPQAFLDPNTVKDETPGNFYPS